MNSEMMAIARNGMRVLTLQHHVDGAVVVPYKSMDPSSRLAVTAAHAIPDDGREHLMAMAIDCQGQPLAWNIVSSGTVDAVMFYPRDVFAWALLVPGVRFVGVAHNHPSGNVEPSGADVSGTANLAACGKALGVDLAWSLVVTHLSNAWRAIELNAPPKAGGDDGGDVRPEAGKPEPKHEPKGEPDPGEMEPEETGIEPELEGGPVRSEGGGRADQRGADLDALRKAVGAVLNKAGGK